MFDTPWQYPPPADLDRTLRDRLQSSPREPDMLVYAMRSLAALSLRAALRIYHRLEIVGREHLPLGHSFVLVANHSSHLDAPCLLSALPIRTLHCTFPVAAQDYFFDSLPRAALSAVFLNATPFARREGARESLEQCRRLLSERGNILILFPEGTRSPTGRLGAFRPGVGSLLAGTEIPAVPCALHGTWRAWPKGAFIPRPKAVRLTIGPPRTFGHLPPDRSSADTIAQELQSAVEDLLCR